MQYTDEYFMKLALREAEKAFEHGEVPIGAIVVYNNKVIGKGYNQVELLQDTTAHAEMLAITAATNHIGNKYLMDATLYVTVEPCLMCSGALYWSKVGKIVFGIRDEKNGYEKYFNHEINPKNHPFHPKAHIKYGVLADECQALMQTFFQQLRSKRL